MFNTIKHQVFSYFCAFPYQHKILVQEHEFCYILCHLSLLLLYCVEETSEAVRIFMKVSICEETIDYSAFCIFGLQIV